MHGMSDLNCRVTPDCQVMSAATAIGVPRRFAWTVNSTSLRPAPTVEGSPAALQEHSYGPGGPCPAVTMCDTCGVSYCEECRDEYGAFGVLYCDACGTSYCEDCCPTGSL